MAANLPLAVFLFLLAATAAAVLAGATAVPVTATHGYGGGRMVIIRGATGTTGGGARSSKWQRRLEDEVAPEFGGLLGADQGHIGVGALDKDRTGCQKDGQCAAKPEGGSYTRPCTYKEQCRGG